MIGKQPVDSLGSSLIGVITETETIVDTNNDVRRDQKLTKMVSGEIVGIERRGSR